MGKQEIIIALKELVAVLPVTEQYAYEWIEPNPSDNTVLFKFVVHTKPNIVHKPIVEKVLKKYGVQLEIGENFVAYVSEINCNRRVRQYKSGKREATSLRYSVPTIK